MKRPSILLRRWVSAAIMLVLVGQACTFELFEFPTGATATPAAAVPPSTPYPVAQTTFIATLPEPLQANETLFLVVLDEVTGLPLRPAENRYQMTARDTVSYTANLALTYNSVVKYYYQRVTNGAPFIEDTALDTPIRYRMHNVAGPYQVMDIVASWSDRVSVRAKGIIKGTLTSADTNLPIPNLLVTAGGIQQITDSFGRFELNGVPAGDNQLTIYSLDGGYLPFQQGATVLDGQTTEVNLAIKTARLVNVTFNVRVPNDPNITPPPVRIAGNILPLGNSFANLQGGMSVVPNRMPTLELQPDGKHSKTLQLPVGTYIQYKYTLGDGYWNAERRASDGGWVVREFIVPEQDVVLEDLVDGWKDSTTSGPILFEVAVPSVTRAEDIIYIQFNHSYGWAEPIPMWNQGGNRWYYKLYGPLNFNGSFTYRYCRNGQCGSADDNQTVGSNPAGFIANTALLGQDLPYTVGSWKWYENPENPQLVGYTINQRAAGFVAGVEFQPTYRPNFSDYADQAFKNTKEAVGANLVVLTPSWSYTSVAPLKLNVQPGQDPLWSDTGKMVQQAKNIGLNVALFPTPQFKPSADTSIPASTQFWKDAPKDAAWWQAWFSQYRAFLINYADLAAQSGAQTFIIGGDWVTPALPGGLLPDGSASNVPADAETQWRSMLQDVRARFKGQVLWALPYQNTGFTTPVNFLRDVDGIYLLWSVPLASSPTAAKTDYTNEAGRLLDTEVQPLSIQLGKPIILALSYPSASGAASGCIPNGSGSCLDVNTLSRPNSDNTAVTLSLQTQTDIYESVLVAVNGRSWISGFVSRGYFMPVALQDKSTSVHGKPAGNVLWYWYRGFQGIR
jgi:hypothetical protein